jgi:hypothetical protein
VAILFNRGVVFSAEKVIQDNLGRYVTISGKEVSFVNIYAPTEGDSSFFCDIANIIASNAKGMIIVGGDFNCVLDGKIDRLPMERNQSKKSRILNTVIGELGLGDP